MLFGGRHPEPRRRDSWEYQYFGFHYVELDYGDERGDHRYLYRSERGDDQHVRHEQGRH